MPNDSRTAPLRNLAVAFGMVLGGALGALSVATDTAAQVEGNGKNAQFHYRVRILGPLT